jgi:hypothetical protein
MAMNASQSRVGGDTFTGRFEITATSYVSMEIGLIHGEW